MPLNTSSQSGPGDVVDVDPEALTSSGQSLSAGAAHLRGGLERLDAEVREALGAWTGAAGGAYSDAWGQWHSGSQKVQSALAIIADWLAQAGPVFQQTDEASARAIAQVHGG